ncbi:MAG: TolC family protein [Bacteroidales bacterium]|nr:TolC family protein [Bacteroidales bacterium]
MKKILIYIGCFLFSFNIFSQQIITLDKCREMAVENSKQQQIASQTTQKQKYEYKSYKANFFPDFSAAGSYMYTSKKINYNVDGGYLPTFVPDESGNMIPNILTTLPDGSPVFKEYAYFPGLDFNIDPRRSYFGGIKVEQPIYMGGKILASTKMASIGTDIAQLNEKLTKQDVIVKADEAYWNLVRAKEMVIAVIKYKDVIEELYRNVNNAVNVGKIHKNDALKVRVKLNEAKLNLLRANNAQHLASMNLCYVVGLPMTTLVDVEDSDSKSISIPENYDITARPEYQMLSKQIDLKKQQSKLIRSDYLPNAGIMAMYGYMNGLKINGDKVFDNANFAAMLSVNIPLFHWGEGRNKINAAKAEQKIAELKRSDIEQQLILEINQVHNALVESQMEVELTKSSLEQAEENMRDSENLYKVGKVTLADYLESQTSWQKAWAESINAKASFKLNETKYLKAIGELQ